MAQSGLALRPLEPAADASRIPFGVPQWNGAHVSRTKDGRIDELRKDRER